MTKSKHELATFGAGCFWCVEAVFKELKGVQKVVSGYAGGELANPSYEAVSRSDTGHTEAVQITFNPQIISYKKLLEVFWLTHDPTTPNRQGNDVGPQYRSVIFYHDEAQKRLAEESKRSLVQEQVFDQQIVTEIVPYTNFYPAEAYHQNYYAKNPQQPYCRVVINPKLAKFRQKFLRLLKN